MSGAVTITGNVVTVMGKNNGIQVGVGPSVSHDAPPTNRVVITGNHVEGPHSSFVDTVGILMPDVGTIGTTVSGNYVADFAHAGRNFAGASVLPQGSNAAVDQRRADGTGFDSEEFV